jgi:cation diffusion facilitator CzcD-associated flavoprotein CzcO
MLVPTAGARSGHAPRSRQLRDADEHLRAHAVRAGTDLADAVSSAAVPRDRRIVVIGAGPGGLCAAIRLTEEGYHDVVLVERAPAVGGTWFHNRYPGAACDVPSHMYSFSFAPKLDWTRPYATQPEILRYFEDLAEQHGLTDRIRLGTAISSMRWDDTSSTWHLATDEGDELVADVVVSAIGMFTEKRDPAIPGLADFGGTVLHSADWDGEADLDGKTVAVIGTAASGVQLIPEVARRAGRLHVFQRTANWVLPKEDVPYTDEELERFRADPGAAAAVRDAIRARLEAAITYSDPVLLLGAEDAGRANLEVVEDPDVRRRLTPDVPWGCQRPLASNDYYPTFNLPHVELVTDAIDHVDERGIVTADGVARAVDVIVLATGFAATRFLGAIDVTGRDGLRLADTWADGARAYLGVTTAGFPNLFMLYGPNTNNGSILFMLECQVEHVVAQVQRMDDDDLEWIEVRPDVMDDYNERLQADLDGVAVWQASCSGYYRGPSGRIVTQWPHTMAEYQARTAADASHAYVGGRRASDAPEAAAS